MSENPFSMEYQNEYHDWTITQFKLCAFVFYIEVLPKKELLGMTNNPTFRHFESRLERPKNHPKRLVSAVRNATLNHRGYHYG